MTFVVTFSPIGENVTTKVLKKMVLIEIFLINVTTKVSKRTEMPKCKKCKLFGMSWQCKTPSKVAHIIRTLSSFLANADWSVSPETKILNILKIILLVNSVIFCFRLILAKYHQCYLNYPIGQLSDFLLPPYSRQALYDQSVVFTYLSFMTRYKTTDN